jgi:nucleoside-triphosphatase
MRHMTKAKRKRRLAVGGWLCAGMMLLTAAAAGAASWEALGPFGASVETLAMAPADPDIVYVAANSIGLFRSTDGGSTWARTGLVTQDIIAAVLVDPRDARTLYVGTSSGFYVSDDASETWTKRNRGLTSSYLMTLAADPTDANTLYAGAWGGLFKSTNAGEDWADIGSALGGDVTAQEMVTAEASLGDKLVQINRRHAWMAAVFFRDDHRPRQMDGVHLPVQHEHRIESQRMTIKGRVAITGRPGVGKTTLIERVLPLIHLSVGGFVVKELSVCGHRVGFALTDLATGRSGTLAHIHQPSGRKIGRYTVNLQTMEELGVPAVESAIRFCDVVVIDELAPMEMTNERFAPAVESALASSKRLLISTHATFDHSLLHRVRQELHLVRVKVGNRDGLESKLAELLAE